MFKPAALTILFLLFFAGNAQEVSLPADLRQHTLNQYNASLFNPAFSLDRNNPQSVAFWTRWQWQNVDTDPTTLFLNYSRRLNDKSGAALGFFQHNTGIYFNTGGALNYAYQIEFNRLIKLSIGANVFGFVQELADTRFPVTPIPGIPQSTPTNDFILQIAPGFNLEVENFSLSLASENLFDYNFTEKASNTATSDKIFMGMASYDFPIIQSDSTAYIRPSIYLRTIPEQENQIGLNALFSTQKYWIQSGYNNFYGISIGAGGTFFNRFSIGALVEFGTDSSVESDVPTLDSSQPSFEILASYYLGKPAERRQLVASGIAELEQEVMMNNEEPTNEEVQKELEKAEKLANKEEPLELEEFEMPEEQGQVTTEESKEDKKEAKRFEAEKKALAKQKRKDSIATVKKEEEALALLRKQEEEKAKLELEEATKAAELATAEKIIEQERLEKVRKEEEKLALEELRKSEAQRKMDSINEARRAEAIAAELKRKEQARLDSINKAKADAAISDALKEKEKRRQDSIARVNEAKELAVKKAKEEAETISKVEEPKEVEPEVVKPQAGEKYEEVATEDGLEPGYYLIANVFGTKKYFDAFMRDLANKGLQPKSFFRSLNKYNYAYLERYDTISEARRARDSNFNGKFNGKTWIFRVVGK